MDINRLNYTKPMWLAHVGTLHWARKYWYGSHTGLPSLSPSRSCIALSAGIFYLFWLTVSWRKISKTADVTSPPFKKLSLCITLLRLFASLEWNDDSWKLSRYIVDRLVPSHLNRQLTNFFRHPTSWALPTRSNPLLTYRGTLERHHILHGHQNPAKRNKKDWGANADHANRAETTKQRCRIWHQYCTVNEL